MATLMNCPFCGGEASGDGKVRYSAKMVAEGEVEQDEFYYANCMVCGADNKGLVGHRTRDAAIAAWNRRVSPDAINALVVALRLALPRMKRDSEDPEGIDWSMEIAAFERALSSADADPTLHIVFDGFPGPEMPRFVEVETPDGKSVDIGEWRGRGNGLTELVIPGPAELMMENQRLRREMAEAAERLEHDYSHDDDGGAVARSLRDALKEGRS